MDENYADQTTIKEKDGETTTIRKHRSDQRKIVNDRCVPNGLQAWKKVWKKSRASGISLFDVNEAILFSIPI